jgi:hypothetical protein
MRLAWRTKKKAGLRAFYEYHHRWEAKCHKLLS